MKRTTRALGLLILAILIPVTTSGGATATSTPLTMNLDSLGTADGSDGQAIGMSAEVHRAEADESEVFVSVVWSVENPTDDSVVLSWLSDQTYSYSGTHFSGVSVINPETDVRYHPITDSEGVCLCSGRTSRNFKYSLEPGEQVAYWSTFSVPEEAETLDVEIPDFDPIEDIPIS